KVKSSVIIKTRLECTLGGYAYSVAGSAKCSAERRDDSYFTLVSGDGVVACRGEQRILNLADVGVMLAQVLKNTGVRPGEFGIVGAFAVEGHFLDKAYVYPTIPGQFREGYDVVDVPAFHHHCVNLKWDVMLHDCVEGIHYPVELITSCDGSESCTVERVKAEVDGGNYQCFEFGYVWRGEHTVGREVQIPYSWN